jgi:hypothetical protein
VQERNSRPTSKADFKVMSRSARFFAFDSVGKRYKAGTQPIIRLAVAFALPTTPGMPAPGWVPAPTK